jgi:FKBP-type peptidyl-prolyl cis-trans isomerase (trigger factor)
MIKKETKQKNISTLARSEDGTIQITFTISYPEIQKAKEDAAKELSDRVNVPGFRRGMAPLEKVLENIDQNELLEKSLAKILPGLINEAVQEYKIKPAIYPKFELVSAQEGQDWQIRAITCELPEVSLGDYKQSLATLARGKNSLSSKVKAGSIWVPGNDAKSAEKTPAREEKEQIAIKTLLESVKINISKVLLDEETNSRLSKLLERLEKLGLSLDTYLSSVGKTAIALRQEYDAQAKDALTLDLILTKIAELEKIEVDKKELETAVTAGKSDPQLVKELDTPERRKFIEVLLKRRKALDFVTSLI